LSRIGHFHLAKNGVFRPTLTLTNLTAQAAQYGFPMVISWYLLVRMEEKLEKLTQSIEPLRVAVNAK